MRTAWLAVIGTAVLLTSASRLNANEGDESVKRAVEKLGGEVVWCYIFTSLDGDDHEYSNKSRLNDGEIKELKRDYWQSVEYWEGGLADVPDPRLEVRVSLFATNATNADLDKLAPLQDEVAVLDLTYTKVTDAGLGRLRFLNLQKLYLTSTPVKGEAFGEVGRFEKLKELGMDYTLVTNEGMAALGNLTHLEKLDLSGLRILATGAVMTDRPRVTALEFEQLGKHLPEGLQELYLWDIKAIDKAGRPDFIAVPNLTGHHIKTLELNGSKINDMGIAQLGDLQELADLDLAYASVTDAGLRVLNGLPLKTLNLSWTRVSERGVLTLRPDALVDLDVSYTPVTDDWVDDLARTHPKLNRLDLSGTRVTRRALDILQRRNIALEWLYLSDTETSDDDLIAETGYLACRADELKGLSLSRTKVTADGLRGLRKFTRLERLYLEDGPATDALVNDVIRDMSNLKYLFVHGSKVTDNGMDNLHELRPNLLIRR